MEIEQQLILFIVYYFIVIGFIIVILNKNLPRWYTGLVIFLLIKTIFNYNKCTFSYLECKLRNVKKEEGYIYNFLSNLINLRNTDHNLFIYFSGVLFLVYYFFIKKNKFFKS
jgi:hypothetical protein